MAGLQIVDGGTIHILKVSADTVNKQPWTADNGYNLVQVHKENYFIPPGITDWVQNVPRLGLFFNRSQWYEVTGLPVFIFVL